jgi:hypothetical protein
MRVLGEHADAGQKAQQPIQLPGVDARRRREVRRRLRAVREQIGDAELGGDADGLGHQPAGDQLEHLLRRLWIHRGPQMRSAR